MKEGSQPVLTAWLDRILSRFAELRPFEGRAVMLFFIYALLMMVSYYIIKTVREPLLLAGSGAEMKSYAYAVVAVVLLVLVPLYGAAFRTISNVQLTRYVTLFFSLNLALFMLAGHWGLDVGFAYYVWVGVFGVFITAQFWAFAADSFNTDAGKRLFPLIMVGATTGGLLAPWLSGQLFQSIGPWMLMGVAVLFLLGTLPLVSLGRSAVPQQSVAIYQQNDERGDGGLLGGLALVFSDRYLFLLALLILLLNWVNTTGEYILAELVIAQAEQLQATEQAVSKSDFIAGFYGTFFFTVNALTLLAQLFLVARIIRWIGVHGAVLVLPIIALLGYGLIMYVPIFSLIQVIKIIENSTDYSLMNTTRHALYLPLPAAHKYEGKTTIDSLFWRLGDLLQAAVIYAGLNWFDFGIVQFAFFNMVLAAVWLVVAWHVARLYREFELTPQQESEQ